MNYFRFRKFDRLRYSNIFKRWLSAQAAKLGKTPKDIFDTYLIGQHLGMMEVEDLGTSPVSKLKAATQYNPIHISLDTPGATGYAIRTPGYVGGGDLSSIALDFSNWALQGGSGELLNTGNALTLVAASIEYNGVVVPAKFSGARGITLADGATNIVTDEIPASAFGASVIPLGAAIYVKCDIRLPDASAKIPFSDRKVGASAAGQVLVYTPASTTLSGVDAAGLFTSTGTAPDAGRASGYSPYVVGRHVSPAAIAVMARGDSITVGIGDNPYAGQTPTGPGYFQRALHALPNQPGALNFAVAGSITLAGTGDERLAAYYGYCNRGYVDYATNDIQFGTSAADAKTRLDNLVAQLKAKGISKVLVGMLTYKTTSTDSWATETNQTVDSVFATGGVRDQVNTLIKSGGYDAALDFPSVKGVTNNHAWLANTTADGLHPNMLGNQLMATDASSTFQATFGQS